MDPTSAQMVQSMLVPGILIIASAILLFSTNSRYTMVVERIRMLKEERASLRNHEGKGKYASKMLDRIEIQLSHLIIRISLVRITIASYSAAVLFFVVSCVLLGAKSNVEITNYYWVTIAFIFGGLLGIINGVVFSVIEVFKAYRIIRIEISEINQELEQSQ